jgi:hypothetical protein
MVGKAVLGLAANENAFSPLFNSIGAKMPLTYKDSYFDKNQNKWMDAEDGKDFKTRLLLLHNKFKNGQISLSDINSYDAINKIADVFSQGMNGWVDVEKDAWVFYIQGNLEISPVMLYLIKAGVPVRDAIMFVSNPLIFFSDGDLLLVPSSFEGDGLVVVEAITLQVSVVTKLSASTFTLSVKVTCPSSLNFTTSPKLTPSVKVRIAPTVVVDPAGLLAKFKFTCWLAVFLVMLKRLLVAPSSQSRYISLGSSVVILNGDSTCTAVVDSSNGLVVLF